MRLSCRVVVDGDDVAGAVLVAGMGPAGFTLAHHQLLALHAPRSFLLVGGEADRPASWQYIQEAQKVYRLYGREDAVGFFDHASGHSPTEESLRLAYRWLAEQFSLPEQPWVL